ncbi:hypothetical protein BDM02DRAFT_3258165 [Thelephora ganbajun]|uniref:Uncharacterized protein n=1 Tax=Thelephora ganbajun TaxID=370292 RepID=A0ACB6ZTX8_THEGA|nr:hypothetical protein BDM02DRAFT_3258165 [Thelephora ganbajun]
MFDIFDPTRPQHHYRTELNNFLQVNGGPRRLRWETSQHGPQHELIWTAICYTTLPSTYSKPTVDETEYGRASGHTLGHAKERAAHMTHRALLFQNFRQRTGMVA